MKASQFFRNNYGKIITIVFFLLVVFAKSSFAQTKEDSVVIEKEDTVQIRSYASRFNPRKALLYAAVVPGLGQIYNKKYWKLPLVYGGFGAMYWNINRFNNGYINYKAQLFYNLQHGKTKDT